MSTVGTVVRDPGIVPLPTTNNILRGQMVSFTPGVGTADGNACGRTFHQILEFGLFPGARAFGGGANA